MRHRRNTHKLSRNATNRKALLRNLVRSLIIHERIITTYKKAKAASSLADKLISLGKAKTITAKKNAISILGSKELINKLFDEIAPRFVSRNGGYTRVLHFSVRPGDGASTAVLELTERKIVDKKAKEKGPKKAKEKKEADMPEKEENAQAQDAEKAKPRAVPPKSAMTTAKEKLEEKRGREKAKSEQEKLQHGFLKGLRGYFHRKSG